MKIDMLFYHKNWLKTISEHFFGALKTDYVSDCQKKKKSRFSDFQEIEFEYRKQE